MIDNLALGLSHGLMMLAAILLLRRPDLDAESKPRDTGDTGGRADTGSRGDTGSIGSRMRARRKPRPDA